MNFNGRDRSTVDYLAEVPHYEQASISNYWEYKACDHRCQDIKNNFSLVEGRTWLASVIKRMMYRLSSKHSFDAMGHDNVDRFVRAHDMLTVATLLGGMTNMSKLTAVATDLKLIARTLWCEGGSARTRNIWNSCESSWSESRPIPRSGNQASAQRRHCKPVQNLSVFCFEEMHKKYLLDLSSWTASGFSMMYQTLHERRSWCKDIYSRDSIWLIAA